MFQDRQLAGRFIQCTIAAYAKSHFTEDVIRNANNVDCQY